MHFDPDAVIPKRVKPLSKRFAHMDFIFLYESDFFVERTGEIHPYSEAEIILREPRSIIVTDSSYDLLSPLMESLGDRYPTLDWRYFTKERTFTLYHSGDDSEDTRVTIEEYVVRRFGISPTLIKKYGGSGLGKQPAYHFVLDVPSFFGTSINTGDESEIEAAVYHYRDLCRDEDIPLVTGRGEFAKNMLRRCLTAPERKVPRATNDKVRKAMPGNYIRRYMGPTEVVKTAVSYDQRSSHHQCAKDIHFPHRDHFVARGNFHNLTGTWITPGGSAYRTLYWNHHGVLYVEVEQWTESTYRKSYPFSPYRPWTGEPFYVTTNELTLMERCGIRVTGVIAAWTSTVVSRDLRKHAKWAQAMALAMSEDDRKWFKPLALSAYGFLAVAPEPLILNSRYSHRRMAANEPVTNHVACRAMLEAECRKRSVMLAMDLAAAGCRVLGIYADAVFVNTYNVDVTQLVPTYFREAIHTNVHWPKGNTVVTDEAIKAPGIPADAPGRRDLALRQADDAPEVPH